jgi:hypothetical protein
VQCAKLKGRYNALCEKARTAELGAIDKLKSYRIKSAQTMSRRHANFRRRIDFSVNYSSSTRVLSGWPHRQPQLPMVPGQEGITTDGSFMLFMPHALEPYQQSRHEETTARPSTSPGRLTSAPEAQENKAEATVDVEVKLELPQVHDKPKTPCAFRSATAVPDLKAAAHPRLAACNATFLPPRPPSPSMARPKTKSGTLTARILNKDLVSLRKGRGSQVSSS